MAVDQARGEYVAFLDHDDIWLPHKLQRQVEVARQRPGLGLIFSDCLFINAGGAVIGGLSGRYDFASIDLQGTQGYRELLFRGCFIDLSTVLARTDTLREAGNFDPRYSYVEDYDMWLRVARKREMFYMAEPLAKRRIHDAQFTRSHPRVALREQFHLLRPFAMNATYPAGLRKAVGDYLLGQQRECCRRLLEQRRFVAAVLTALQMLLLPGRLADSCRHLLSRTPLSSIAKGGERAVRWAWERVRRLLHGRRNGAAFGGTKEVWVDASPLGHFQTGYFNLVVELIRALQRWGRDACVVHVTTSSVGLAALHERLGRDAAGLRTHVTTWGFWPWTALYELLSHPRTGLLLVLVCGALLAAGKGMSSPILLSLGLLLAGLTGAGLLDDLVARVRTGRGEQTLPLLARAIRFLRLRVSFPFRPFRDPDTVEVIVWRGRFRYSGSRKIALVQDLTTQIHPELHTPGNVAEFEDYLRYVLKRADSIATVSESSRRDIVERLKLFPETVQLMPVPVNPLYLQQEYAQGVPAVYGIDKPYLLCLGTEEPRKNMRRLVRAFERLTGEDGVPEPLLVFAGPKGWDEGFGRFLVESEVYSRTRTLGFVPTEQLPSLYHFAAAVVYPSVYEGFGLPVLEASCCSAIVVTARLLSLPKDLLEGCISFDPYHTDELTDALRRALRLKPNEAAAYRRSCRSRAEALLARWGRQTPLPGLSREGLEEA